MIKYIQNVLCTMDECIARQSMFKIIIHILFVLI